MGKIVNDVTEFQCECGNRNFQWTIEPDADNPSYYSDDCECGKFYVAYSWGWAVEELE